MDYRVIAIKDDNGVGIGLERLNGGKVTFIGSYYLPHGSKPLFLNDGYKFAVNKIHQVEPHGKPVTIGVPIKTSLKKNVTQLTGSALGRRVTFKSIAPAERSTELDLAKDGLKRKTNVEEGP
jgi:hypothetical protein